MAQNLNSSDAIASTEDWDMYPLVPWFLDVPTSDGN